MNDQRYTLLQAGATMIGGLMPIPEQAKGVQPAWMGYIAVDDVKAYADKVKAAGGAIRRPPTEIPNVGTFAVVGDPHGAGFLLFKASGGEALRRILTLPARSDGANCMPATARAPLISIRASSAGRRPMRWIWAPWANIRLQHAKRHRAAAS